MKPKVWTEVDLHPEALARLQAKAEVITQATFDDLPGCEAAAIGGSTVDAAFVEKAGPSLKLVIRHGIGYNTVNVDEVSTFGVLAANTPDGPTESTAEHAVALLMDIAKRVVMSDMYLRNNRPYTRPLLRGEEVYDHVLGVVGYGRIGRRVTEICVMGLKMRALIYDPFLPDDVVLPEGVTRVEDVDDLLSQSDFVTLHTPLFPETHHLINERTLALMKQGSYLINVSRGPVVDEAALIQALENGHLAGAALDVFDPEPPEPDNPLLRMDNVVVTPHTASNTPQGWYRMSSGVVDQVIQVLRGERPSDLLNPEVWPGRVEAK